MKKKGGSCWFDRESVLKCNMMRSDESTKDDKTRLFEVIVFDMYPWGQQFTIKLL